MCSADVALSVRLRPSNENPARNIVGEMAIAHVALRRLRPGPWRPAQRKLLRLADCKSLVDHESSRTCELCACKVVLCESSFPPHCTTLVWETAGSALLCCNARDFAGIAVHWPRFMVGFFATFAP